MESAKKEVKAVEKARAILAAGKKLFSTKVNSFRLLKKAADVQEKKPEDVKLAAQANMPDEELTKIITLYDSGMRLISEGKSSEAGSVYKQLASLYRQSTGDLKKEIYSRATKLHAEITKNAAVKKKEPETDLIDLPVKEILTRLNLVDYSSPYIAVEEEIISEKTVRKKIMTGVPGFDSMISEGIPVGSSILVSGGPGSGKTTFCIQMLGWSAKQGEKCLFMTFEESEEELIEHMESYGLNPRRYLAEGTLAIQRQDPFKISRMIEALLAHERGELLIDIESILDIVPKGFKPDRVVIDSLSAISSAFSESSTAYRIYVNQLVDLLKKTGATSFLISEVQGIENIGHGLVEEFLADGVIVFYNLQKGSIKQNALEILKMRAVGHEKKIVPFEFVKDTGIIVYPLEKIFM